MRVIEIVRRRSAVKSVAVGQDGHEVVGLTVMPPIALGLTAISMTEAHPNCD